MQDIDLQSPLNQAQREIEWRQNTTNAVDDIAAISEPFRPSAVIGTLSQAAKVMIVDDEPVNVKVVQYHLKLAGYRHFVTSTDPRPVMEMVTNEMPDVILLDVMMPFVSGLQILQSLRENEGLAHIPAIVLTASDNKETKMEALNLGAVDFLGKPVDSAELIVRVRNALLVKAHHDHLKNYSRDLEVQVRQQDRGIGRLATGADPLPGQDRRVSGQRDGAARSPRRPLRRDYRPATGYGRKVH